MKKLITVCLCAALCACLLAGCGTKKAELALIADKSGVDDHSYNQGAWEGIVKYAEEKKISRQYYEPKSSTTEGYLDAIGVAVKNGARLVILPGPAFETAVYLAQEAYPDTNFVLLDGKPHNADYTTYETRKNTVSVSYAEEESGFLAGYALVKEGFTALGFLGGDKAYSPVVHYGYGFVQGAEYAAQQLQLPEGSIVMQYGYTGSFLPTPEAKKLASSWYRQGTQIIFACGGKMGQSVMEAAKEAGTKVVGVDVDQSFLSETVFTSAMKSLGISVYDVIKQFYTDAFPGGQDIMLNAANNGVALAMENGKFETFTQADYDDIYARLANNTDGILKQMVTDPTTDGAVEGSGIVLNAVVVNDIQ